MPKLQAAGFMRVVLSYFQPKKLDVQVRAAVTDNGDLSIEPVFLIDGFEVPSGLVTADVNQRILGHRVEAGKAAQDLMLKTKGRVVRVAKSKAGHFLDALSTRGISIRGKDGVTPFTLKAARTNVSLTLRPDDSLHVSSQLVTEDGVVLAKPPDLEALRRDDGWHAIGDDLVKVELTNTPLDQVLVPESGTGTLQGTQVPRFLRAIENNRKRLGEVEKNERLTGLSVFTASPSNRVVITGDDNTIQWEPHLTFTAASGTIYDKTEADVLRLERMQNGFERVNEGWLEIDSVALNNFTAARDELNRRTGERRRLQGTDIPKTLSTLREAAQGKHASTPWNVYYTKAVADSHRLCDTPSSLEFQLNIIEADGRALLHLDPVYCHERFRLTHTEAESTASAGEEWVRRPGAWIHVDAERYKQVAGYANQLQLQRSGSGYSFPASDRERVLETFSTLGSIRQSEAYASFLLKLQDFQRIDEAPRPRNLKPHIALRSYQQHGFNWLAFLQRFGLNGVLADDMGLGKTLQTLTVIERAREATGSHLPALIICPTSVMLNWKAEIDKFLQTCEVVVYHGPHRGGQLNRIYAAAAAPRSSGASFFVITSYDTARLDHEDLNRIRWLYVVVDEGHNIKNPSAQRTRAIKTISGQHKLALTGTPIQNKLEELWSLFDFAMPGFLGSRSSFRQRYSTNNRLNLTAVQQELIPRIKPFVMRRLKAHVAKDLPEKIIVDTRLELTPVQVHLYKQALRSTDYHKLVEDVERNGVRQSQLQILAVLTKLRNICNHPVLVTDGWSASEVAPEESGKLEHLHDLMDEIVEGEHRALLFSQSTRVLDIIEHLFARWGIRCLRIDGNTPAMQRARLADEYNANPAIHCFLLSTKAAGTGLNLTGADTVIFYDHDWNPANDDQAMDRAYRIGQTRNVTVYRLVSKGTIEERILERQSAKRSLADDVIGSDEQGFKDITREELLDLFRFDDDD